MACEFDGGVIIGADSRATTGYASFPSKIICIKLFTKDAVIV